jgi:hypothetical protein
MPKPLGQIEDVVGQLITQLEYALAAGGQGESLGFAIVVADRAAGLHGADDDPVVDQVDAADRGGLGEGRIGGGLVAQLVVDAEVARRLVPDQRGPGRVGSGQVGVGRQLLIVDHDQLGSVARLAQAFRHHGGHRIAHVAYPVAGQHRMGRLDRLAAGLAGDRRHAGNVADALGLEILGAVDRHYARRRKGLNGVDGQDLGVGIGAADQHHDRLIALIDVVVVAALAGEEASILHPTQALAGAELTHDWRKLPRCVVTHGRARDHRRPAPGLQDQSGMLEIQCHQGTLKIRLGTSLLCRRL